MNSGIAVLDDFGLPQRVAASRGRELADALESSWRSAFGYEPRNWLGDLEALKIFYDPVATGKRLREALSKVEETGSPLTPPMAISVGDRHLITPEGRAALELLRESLKQKGSDVGFDPALAAQLQADLLEAYRSWSRHRLLSVVDLLGGGAKPLQMPAMGSVLVLLVNRSDSRPRAIPRFRGDDNPRAQEQIDAAVFACADAFASTLNRQSRRKPGKERLISGWTLHEITRRLPGALIIDDAGVYVVAARKAEVIDLLAKELAQRARTGRQLEEAFDALVSEFRLRGPVLAAHQSLFERPGDTENLKERLVAAWREHAA
ncbi:MAG: hypothetical protein Q7T55_04470 [Solirubrobacteraceae bacterium]|nr:hypothetical protein [Solirubrobacteraceae bacterium]